MNKVNFKTLIDIYLIFSWIFITFELVVGSPSVPMMLLYIPYSIMIANVIIAMLED